MEPCVHLRLIEFQDVIAEGKKKISDIKPADLWQKIRVFLWGNRLSEIALLSRHAYSVPMSSFHCALSWKKFGMVFVQLGL